MSYSLRQSPILMPTGRITGLYDIMSSGKYQKEKSGSYQSGVLLLLNIIDFICLDYRPTAEQEQEPSGFGAPSMGITINNSLKSC